MSNFWQTLQKPSIFGNDNDHRQVLAKESELEISDRRGFWKALGRPIFALAPMQDVTDCAFREIFAKYGKSEKSDKSENRMNNFVMFTEFVNVDGLLHPEGFERLKIALQYTEIQRPIVAQIWGRDPEKFKRAAQIIAKMGFDGIDINFGCPQDKEIAQKTCAALIREPELAGQIIEATIKGAADTPVSVKTRLGYSKPDEMEVWLNHLLKYPLAAITIHARTKQEKSKVPARWEKIKEAVEIRNIKHGAWSMEQRTLIIGNGDIKSREEAFVRIKETNCDGVMIGRGAFGNPWVFRKDNYQPSVKEKLQVMLEHARLYEKMYKSLKSFATMLKNFKAYSSGFPGSHELRAKLMETNNLSETRKIVGEFLNRASF